MNAQNASRWLMMLPMLALLLTGCGDVAQHEEHTEHDTDHAEPLRIATATQQALGFQIVPAAIKPLERMLELTGQVAQDSEGFAHVYPSGSGVITEITARVGERVEHGTPLAVLDTGSANSLLPITAPVSGLVIGVHTQPGASVDTLTSLMTVADLSQVWATFDLYEQDAGLVRVGQRIDAVSVAYPDHNFPGQVIFVSPQVDQHTRMIKVRAQVENPDYALKLGMFVTGRLYIPMADDTLVVPQTALQRIEDERVVFVQQSATTFEMRVVTVGDETTTHAQIAAGLQPGERVVAHGSFHLKAEVLKGSLEEGHAH